MLGAAVVVVAAAVTSVGVNNLLDPGGGTTQVVTADGRESVPAAVPTVSVVAEGLDRLSVETTPLSESPDGWLQHTVTLRNVTAETVYVNDFRNWAWLGDEEVLAATEGCHPTGMDPVSGGCLLNHLPTTLEPGAEHSYVITLWRDLPGMNPPTDGPFEWRLGVSTSTVGTMPLVGGDPGTLVLTYDGLSQPDAAEVGDDMGVTADESAAQFRRALQALPILDEINTIAASFDDLTQRSSSWVVAEVLSVSEPEVRLSGGARSRRESAAAGLIRTAPVGRQMVVALASPSDTTHAAAFGLVDPGGRILPLDSYPGGIGVGLAETATIGELRARLDTSQ